MQIIKKRKNDCNYKYLLNYISKKLNNEAELSDIIFFDIETTGLSYKNSMCYMIGYGKYKIYKDDVSFITEQFFANTPDLEKEIIEKFFYIAKDHKYIISFNGTTFDIKFINERARLLEIDSSLSDNFNLLTSIDLFSIIKKDKKILNLENYKQKTIEDFLNIKREDTFTGKELISIYKKYVIEKNHEAKEKMTNLLLLHNYEDLTGLTDILPILSYLSLTDITFKCSKKDLNSYTTFEQTSAFEFIISLNYDFNFPVSIKRVIPDKDNNQITCMFKENELTFIIPLFSGEMKYFFKDYSNYYYLPDEDYAIHKSIAGYVDKSHKVKAKKENCYVKSTGLFLPVFEKAFASSINKKQFSNNFSSNSLYIQWEENLITDCSFMNNYIISLLNYIS